MSSGRTSGGIRGGIGLFCSMSISLRSMNTPLIFLLDKLAEYLILEHIKDG